MSINAVGQPQAADKEYQGKISAGAHFQVNGTGECSIAVAQETVTQIETVRGDGDEPLPKGADNSTRALQNAVQKSWEPTGQTFDFSEATKGHGAAIQDVLPILSAKFNIHSQPITIAQLPEALKHGPVMVVVHYHGTDHGEVDNPAVPWWHQDTEARRRALRVLCHDPVLTRTGARATVQLNFLTVDGAVEGWTFLLRLGKTVQLAGTGVRQVRKEHTFFFPI